MPAATAALATRPSPKPPPRSGADCPSLNADLRPDFFWEQLDAFTDPIAPQRALRFLNSGGSPMALADHLWADYPNVADEQIRIADLDGNGSSEVVLALPGPKTMIIGCKHSAYTVLLDVRIATGVEWASNIRRVSDINGDGLPDVVISTGTCNGGCTDLQIISWDGANFRNLINWDNPFLNFDIGDLDALKDLVVLDLNGDGVMEVIVTDGAPFGNMAAVNGLYPWRDETWLFEWDGVDFSVAGFEFSPPRYRFEALIDADQAALRGEFAKAVQLYRQVITDDTLDWWSKERSIHVSSFPLYGQAPPPAPRKDLDEYPNLVAYSLFHLVVVNAAQGATADSMAAYEQLIAQFVPPSPGAVFAGVATTFWEAFESSADVGQACNRAVSYARGYEDAVLKYLPGVYHGASSPRYVVDDVCPF